MDKEQLKEKYRRFRQWQEQPFEYKLASDRVHHCNNCNHDFTGNYCPVCSQKAGLGRVGWRSVHQGVMDIWGLGTRSLLYSIWQLLLRPGHIIGDYIDGKRQVSFPPVKMLFIVTLIYSMVVYWFFPDVLHMPVEEAEEQTNELYLWFKNHFSWAMLITSTFAILPTWVMFRYSPRHTAHSLPEGFFIQVFFQVIVVVWMFLFIPFELIGSTVISVVSLIITMIYYIIGYKQLFGYSLWGTLWRQGFVILSGALALTITVLIAFSGFFNAVVDEIASKAFTIAKYICLVFILLSPIIILAIGHVINLFATKKFRRGLKQAKAK